MTHENETALGMDQDTNIALGVSAIPIIKNDILTVAGQMDAAVYDGVLSECEKKLSTKIDEIFNEFNSSNSTDKKSLFEQLNTLFEGQSDMQAVITKLRNAIISLETGGEEGSVLSEETIKNVLNAALTTESFWTDDTIGAPSVLGQKIIGLVGEFGEVKASSLKGDTIEGLTLQSHLKDEDDKPLWQINKEGDGHLAGGNISWNDDGTIQIGSETKGLNFNSNGELTFGSDVTLSWDNIIGAEEVAMKDDIQNAGLSDEDREKLNTVITKDSIQTDTLVADNLTVRNLNTKNNESLSTTRNVIVAKDNYLKVYNNVGNVATTLTSDKLIDFDVADGDTEVENKNDSNYVQQVNFEETGVSVWTHQTVQNLRFDIGEITFKQIGDNVESANISVSYGVRACSGSPFDNSLAAWGAILPYGKKSSPRGDIQDGSFQILSSHGKQPKICLYKKLDDGTYASEPSYTQTEILNNGYRTVSETFPAVSSQDPVGRVRFTYDCSSIDINSISIPGTFKISIIFPRGSIIAKEDFDNYLRLSVNTTLTISKAFGDFVFIGKDGIIVNTDKNTFILNNDGTVLKSGTKSRFFGIKVTPSGMYFCNGGNTWSTWNPSSE